MANGKDFLLFAGTSHEGLAKDVARSIGIELGPVNIESFPDGEIGAQVLDNVRGKDVFLLQSIARRPNHYLVELLILVDAIKRSSAKSITAVIPYYGYARQDRKDKGRVPITARLVADLLEKSGVSRVLTLDLHTEQIQGFFDIPVDNLYARKLLVRGVRELGKEDLVVVSPDLGSNKLARQFAEDLGVEIAIVDKRRVNSKQVEANALIGDVKNKHAVIVDDICSTGGTLATAAKVCRREGAKSVVAAVTHGLMLGDSMKDSGIDEILVTDSVPESTDWNHVKTKVITIAPLLGKAIERLALSQSLSSLFFR